MLFKNFSSFEGRSSSLRCRDHIVSRPARKVKLRNAIPTASSLLVGEIDPASSKHADGYPVYKMEETPSTVVGRRRFPDEFSSGSPISGKSKRTEDIPIREDEDGIRSHCCPLNPELDGRDWDEDYPSYPVQFDFNFEKLVNGCSVPSEDIPLLISLKGSSSESDEESDGSVVGYTPLESEASSSRNSPVSLTDVEYASLEDEPLANENSAIFQKYLMPRFLQWTEKASPYVRLEEETMEAWLDDSSDEFEYYAPYVKLLPNVKPTIENESDMEEFEQDSDTENENADVKLTKNEEKKDDGHIDKGDRSDGNKDFSTDFKSSKNNYENQSSTEYPSKQSKNECSKSKDVCKNQQLSKLSAQNRNQNQKEYPELNKDEDNKDFSTVTKSPENNAKIKSSAEPSNKMYKADHLNSEDTSKNEQVSNMNTQEEIQNEKEHVKINLVSDSILIDLHYLGNADRNETEPNLNTQEKKKEGKENANVSKNEQPRNLNARDENKNQNKYPEYNTESDSTAIGIHLLDNVDSNSIESNLKIQDDYKDMKEENISKNSNENEQSISLNAEDENQSEKKYPECNTERGSTSTDTHSLDNDDRNCIESYLNTQDDYRNKKEERESQSNDKIENPTNLNAEDENQNKKRYPKNNIENDSTSKDIFLLDIACRNDVESKMNTQDDSTKGKKDEKESESTKKSENSNVEGVYQNEKKYPEKNIESDSIAIDIFLLDNTDRNDIESNMDTQDDYTDKADEKESESTNKNKKLNAEYANQNEKKYSENNIESDSTSKDIFLLDNIDRNYVESKMNSQDDYKDRKDEKESKNTDKKDQPTNLNSEAENQNEKKYPENNLENHSSETDVDYFDITDRNGIESNLNAQDENKDKKEESKKDSLSYYFSEDISLPDFDSMNRPVSNLSTHMIARLKFHDLLRTLLQDENKVEKEKTENEAQNDFFSGVIHLEDFDNINGSILNLNIQDENKEKNIEIESDLKDDYIFDITNFKEFVSLNRSALNLNVQDEINDNKTRDENELMNDYIFEIMSFPDFVNVNESVSSLNIHDKKEDKKEFESYSKSDFISESLPLTDSSSINKPVSNLTTQDEIEDKNEHFENDLKTDCISEGIHWAHFDSENVFVSNSNIQDKNKVKIEHPENNLETSFTKNFLHLADNGQKETNVTEIKGFPNKIDDNRTEFSYNFFSESQTKSAIKPKVKENMDNLTGEPYGRASPKSIKKDVTQSGLKRLQRFMSGVYPTKDKNELHFEPSITRDVEDKVPLEEKGIIFNVNDALVLSDLPVHNSDGFQPVLTEEQKVSSRQPNKLTKFFQSLKKKLERNKKA